MTQPKIEGVGHGAPRMLYASDGSNWYALLVDSDGHVKIDVVAYPGSNVLGNFPFGYYDRYLENLSSLNATLGTNYLLGTVVPAGEVWVLTAAFLENGTTAAGRVGLGVYDGATYTYALSTTYLTPTRATNWSGYLIAKAGDKFFGAYFGCVVGDDITAYFLGYKMKIA